MAPFVTLFADSYGGLQEKSFKRFKFSIICVLPQRPQYEIPSRFFCYSVCLLGFWVEESFATEFNESES